MLVYRPFGFATVKLTTAYAECVGTILHAEKTPFRVQSYLAQLGVGLGILVCYLLVGLGYVAKVGFSFILDLAHKG